MKNLTRIAALLLVVAAFACGKHEHEEAKAPEREALSFTHFTDRTSRDLFAGWLRTRRAVRHRAYRGWLLDQNRQHVRSERLVR